MAKTEESRPPKTDREAGSKIERPARWKTDEVPSRAARVNTPQGGINQ